jgi:lipoprotein-anchoring transpeptidase ErfK/SrfK
VRTKGFIAVAAFVAVLLAGAAGVYAFDQGREDEIAEGITVGGIDVGDLERDEARRTLEEQLLEPLKRPVLVDDAIAAGRRGNILSRTVRGLTGEDVEEDVEPRITYSTDAVTRLIVRVARRTDRRARDADLDYTANGLRRVRSRTGFRVDRRTLRTRVERALTQPSADARTVQAPLDRTKPDVTTKQLAEKYDTVLVIDRGGYRLRLFKRLKLKRTYPIAVGQIGLETPAGLYKVQNKAVNPAWNVPNSDWAGELAGRVIPGGVPENPLKARWLGIYNGAGIHGTDARGSIGTNASHGCIRMLVEDVIELYDQVPVGAPVYIA